MCASTGLSLSVGASKNPLIGDLDLSDFAFDLGLIPKLTLSHYFSSPMYDLNMPKIYFCFSSYFKPFFLSWL